MLPKYTKNVTILNLKRKPLPVWRGGAYWGGSDGPVDDSGPGGGSGGPAGDSGAPGRFEALISYESFFL